MTVPLCPLDGEGVCGAGFHDQTSKRPHVQITSEAEYPVELNVRGDRRPGFNLVRIKEARRELAEAKLMSNNGWIVKLVRAILRSGHRAEARGRT